MYNLLLASFFINTHMKIVVLGVARSRTEVLIEKLRILHPELKCHYEFYSYALKKMSGEKMSGDSKISFLTKQLFETDNFIVKIIASNLIVGTGNIEELNLHLYDKIYLIERPDFFNQCCSLQVCKNTQLWHQRKNYLHWRGVRSRQFLLEEIVVLTQARSIDQYIKIKQFLLQNNIPFVLQDYHDKFDIVPKTLLSDPKLPYDKMILNYHMQPVVDALFSTCFNYSTCQSDLDLFLSGFSSLKHEFV